MRKLILLFLVILGSITSGKAQIETGYYLYKQYSKDDKVLNYRILYPNNFDVAKKYPLILFLHGAGERGNDNEKQLSNGGKLFLDSLDKYPAIVIFPQCPNDDYWANLYRPDAGGASRIFDFHYNEGPNPTMTLVISLIDEMLSEPYIDDKRFYISGLSMGAMGIWELTWRMPEKIAASLPICGGGPPEMAKKMTEVPIWAFHGVKDNVVHPRYSRRMVESVQKAGGKAKITLYPDANHNSWDPAFSESKFLSWMFSKSKN